jgi:hypothetical protein
MVQGLSPLSTDRGRLGAANQISHTGNRVPVSRSLYSRGAHAEAPGDLTVNPPPLPVTLEHLDVQRHHPASLPGRGDARILTSSRHPITEVG